DKRSILKPKTEGPAAYVFPGDDPRPGGQAELLRTMQLQGCEISRATAPFSVTVKKKKAQPPAGNRNAGAASTDQKPADDPKKPETTTETRQFPAGSYVIRMDQPYSRIADMLLDYQYWSPNDPQKSIYDDTAWTFGELGNIQVVRVTDVKVLEAPMERVDGNVRAPGGVKGNGTIYVVNHNTDNALMTLRYRFKDAAIEAAEEPFEAAGQKFNRGSFIIRKASADDLRQLGDELGLRFFAVTEAPNVKT